MEKGTERTALCVGRRQTTDFTQKFFFFATQAKVLTRPGFVVIDPKDAIKNALMINDVSYCIGAFKTNILCLNYEFVAL